MHLRVSSSSVMEMSSRDILPCDTSASLAESKTSSLPPLASSAERTSTLPSYAAHEWTDPLHLLASDLAGDLSWDPLPLLDLEPEPNKPDELKQLCPDPRSDPEPLPEEEEQDCEQHGEGDLAHLRLVGEHAVGEEVEGMPSQGSSSASHPVCWGAVEVEANGPVLTPVAALPLYCGGWASFNTSSAFLRLSGGGVCMRSRLWSPS